jgi:hypothetical protein
MSEAETHPNLDRLHPLSARFLRQWQGLWAAYGEDDAGLPAYRAALDAYLRQALPLAQPVRLRNELPLVTALQAQVGKIAVMQPLSKTEPVASQTPSVPQSPASASNAARFDRPVFVVSSPRSGSTMLFEALARAPGVHTIGGESHALMESMPQLHPAMNGALSNRMTADAAVPAVAEELRARFLARMVDREGRPPSQDAFRMLEKTPKNSLRIPFLAQVFSGSHFIYLYRDPCETLGSMIDAWESGRFRTYPQLPGWQGLPWSLLLIPGWQSLVGRPLGEIVAAQWETATRLMLDDLEALPRERVHVVRYDALVSDLAGELRRLCDAVDFRHDAQVSGEAPLSRYTLTPPSPGKWRRHAAQIEPHLQRLAPTMLRAARFAGADVAFATPRVGVAPAVADGALPA